MSEHKYHEREPILPQPLETPRASYSRAGYEPRRRSVFWPILLIGIGGLLLLQNLGILTFDWHNLATLWPLILIGMGVDVLIGRRSTGGAILMTLFTFLLLGLIIAAAAVIQHAPGVVWINTAPLQRQTIAYPRAGLESAAVYLELPSAASKITALEDSDQLIYGEVSYYGELAFDVDATDNHAEVNLENYGLRISHNWQHNEAPWDLGLSPQVALDLTLDCDSGEADVNLTDLQISALNVDASSGLLKLALPDDSSFTGEIEGGSGMLLLVLPDHVGMRIELIAGSGEFKPNERFERVSGDPDDESVWETRNYDEAAIQIELTLDQGSGPVHIY